MRATPPGQGTRGDSFAHLPSRELEEEVLEVRAPVHEAKLLLHAQVLHDGPGLAQVAERRLAMQLGAVAERLAVRLEPAFDALAIDLDHLGLDVPGDEVARRALRERASVVDDLQAIAEPL